MSQQSNGQQEHILTPRRRRLLSRAVYRRVAVIAADASSASDFWLNAFRAVVSHTSLIYAQMAVTSGATVIEDYWHQGPTGPGFWKPTVSAIIDETIGEFGEKVRIFKFRREDRRIVILSAPFVDENQMPIGAIGIVQETSASDDVQALLSDLAGLANYLSIMANSLKQPAPTPTATESRYSGSSLEKMSSVGSLHELAFAVTNNLRNRLGCEQVGLARVRNHRTKILALSGFDAIKARNPGVRVIEAAMEEAIDRGKTTVYQGLGEWDSDVNQPEYRLHRKWHEESGGAAIASIPFKRDEQCVAVLSLRAKPGEFWSTEILTKIEEQVMPYAIGLELVESANRSVRAHALTAGKAAIKSLVAPKSTKRHIIVALLLILALWVAFGSATYRVIVPCVVRPAVAQRYFAPYNGIVESVFVQAGDNVVQGQLLFEMNTQDLQLDLDYLHAQTRMSEIALDEAIKERDVVKAELERGRLNLYDAKRAITNRQLERARMCAAYDGLVTVGDPNLIASQMVALGDPIIEVVPTAQWIVELEIPEASIAAVKTDLSGQLALNARPEVSQSFSISRILPQSHQRNQGRVFIVEGSIETDSGWLRPGMEGTACVEVERKPIWWLASHRFVRAVRRVLWI